MRKIVYFSGTRADFGLMRSTLLQLDSSDMLSLALVVTGMHLSNKYGHTIDDIETSGLKILARVPIDLEPETGKTMALAMSKMLAEFTRILEKERPDIILILGDRGEMLAAALAALHLDIPVAHIHGGERSGTIDESIRHVLTKLSHIHFVATHESRVRLVSLGELPDSIYVSGAPGIDGIRELASLTRAELAFKFSLIKEDPICLLLFHPVVQDSAAAGSQTEVILDALDNIKDLQIVAIMPNSDSGSELIRKKINSTTHSRFQSFSNLSRKEFVSFMRSVDVMVGNSSSGIIEAASFGTPVVNVGNRQNLRQRNSNIIDVEIDVDVINKAVKTAIKSGKLQFANVYGEGHAGKKILEVLETSSLDPVLLNKILTF
jgi:GDP/UDP-N,N'-diacetylbacillosamine 2-epimerase (hydrolysing)